VAAATDPNNLIWVMPAEGVELATAVVFIGGTAPHPDVVARLPVPRFVIAADSGLDHALALDVDVDLVVGDLDSVSGSALTWARNRGIAIESHPTAKEATDTELALEAATARGVSQILVVSGIGDRVDHGLAALSGAASPRWAGARVEAWWGHAHVAVLHGPGHVTLAAPTGSLVSLVPVHGAATGLTTQGLEYPLTNETLPAGTSRGISNVVTSTPTSVSLSSGTVLVITPLALGGTP
jgi:thiamine pyrophosphokinase